jgi:hypothetical protein
MPFHLRSIGPDSAGIQNTRLAAGFKTSLEQCAEIPCGPESFKTGQQRTADQLREKLSLMDRGLPNCLLQPKNGEGQGNPEKRRDQGGNE